MLRIAAPKLIVATAGEYETLQPIAEAIGATVLVDTALPPPTRDIAGIPQNAPDEAAFVQFTSGSTGVPKGIVVEHGQLVELLDACIARSRFRRGETLISWLPLHHDFGLSAGLLMPIQAGNRSILIPTEAFIRNPAIWLLAAEKWGAAFSPAAPFAMQLLTRPIFARKLGNVNLAGLNTIWLGGEPVSAALVHQFEAVYAKLGLRPGVVTAGYGMAEATCTISVRAPESERRTAWVDRRKFHAEGRVEIVPAAAEGSMALLSNGSPLDCFEVRIVNDGGRRLPEGVQGRIEVRGGPVSRRYLGASVSLAPGGWLDTGDLGFLLDQELYITGRTKDVIIRGGVNVNAHEIEETVLRNLADLTQRAVAFSLPHERDMRDEIVVGVEVPVWPAPARLEADIRNVLLRDLALQVDHVVAMQRGAIPRTTSGKIQRGLARERYRAGRLAERA
jgi:acyl-CoA synthetase (AMP-forming)/AMP-acid ligase II